MSRWDEKQDDDLLPYWQSFADTYAAHRHEDECMARATTTRLIPGTPHSSRDIAMTTGRATMRSSATGLLSGLREAVQSARQSVRQSTAVPRFSTTPSGYVPLPQDDFGFGLVGTDLKDENQGAERKPGLPGMPAHQLGVRQRTFAELTKTWREREEKEVQRKWGWVNSSWFNWLCGCVICINAMVVGFETDVDIWAWFWVEQALLAFFCFELLVRLMRQGSDFFGEEEQLWNVFDVAVVGVGVFQQWLVPLGEQLGLITRKGRMRWFFMSVHICRLLRTVRLLRLVRIVRPLFDLAQGVLEALQGMFWVLVFLLMTLYAVAIISTRLIGHGQMLTDEMLLDPEIQDLMKLFSNVPTSMYSLFGTISSWSLDQYAPFFDQAPVFKPIFVIFYVYSAWALLAVMTGVVSENMIAIREQKDKEDTERQETRKQLITQMLRELFLAVDTDSSGNISAQEFDAMLKSQRLTKRITANSRIKLQDVQDLFILLDRDGGGTISIDEFITGFRWLNEPLRTKSLVRLKENMRVDLQRLEVDGTQTFEKNMEEVKSLLTDPINKVSSITKQMQFVDSNVRVLRSSLREHLVSLPTPDELSDAADRLLEKLDDASGQLEYIFAGAEASLTTKKAG